MLITFSFSDTHRQTKPPQRLKDLGVIQDKLDKKLSRHAQLVFAKDFYQRWYHWKQSKDIDDHQGIVNLFSYVTF